MTVLIAEPQLFVVDLDASLSHYARLGFIPTFVHGEPPFYAQIRRDGVRLNLRRVETPAFSPKFLEAEDDVLSATVVADDLAALFAEFESAGVAFHQRLRTEPWGPQTFIVADPDGNRIAFAG